MRDKSPEPASRPKGGKPLSQQVARALRREIAADKISVGDRMPSEAQLSARFSVSRTVLREAVAMLRSEGLIETRQGSGNYVLRKSGPTAPAVLKIDATRSSSLLDALEFRTGVEVEAAGLAAQRRSPAQDQAILEHADAFAAALPQESARPDLAFHEAIAAATNNPMFADFLRRMGPSAIPRLALENGARADATYHAQITAEHSAIAAGISAGDPAAARAAMRAHLSTALERYRKILRQ